MAKPLINPNAFEALTLANSERYSAQKNLIEKIVNKSNDDYVREAIDRLEKASREYDKLYDKYFTDFSSKEIPRI
jgi:hypothetical protein